MARATLTRAVLRRPAPVLCALLLVSAFFGDALGGPAPALAITRTPRGWTVSPGNAAEIQPAIDAARDAGGGAVYLPAGVYLLTAKIRVHSNIAVYGDGLDRTILRWAPGATLDHMMSNGSLSSGNVNIQIRDLTLDGQGIPSGRSDCCFGLRLNNVRDSYVISVAADGHSRDGIHLGYNRTNGVVNVRVANCRANNNGRNGITLVHGDRNIIDHCQVNGNNRGEPVAGIDLEPDQGLAVTNSKIVANVADGQNVGVQLFVPYNGYATNASNAVCYNSASGNRSAGVYDYRGSGNMFVDNQTRDNGTNFLVDDSSLVGSQYASACALPALPPPPGGGTTPPPVPTPAPTPPPASCQPRPAVVVQARPVGAGLLEVTVTAERSSGAPSNAIHQIQFGTAQNATIELGGQSRGAGNVTVPLPPGTQSVSFLVRRAQAGAATTVPFVVIDDCGAWPSFAGGGPGAF